MSMADGDLDGGSNFSVILSVDLSFWGWWSENTEFKDLLRLAVDRFKGLSILDIERKDKKEDFFRLPLGVIVQLIETSEAG